MTRRAWIMMAAVAAGVLLPGWAGAAEGTWPNMSLPEPFRGPGFYLSLPKIVVAWGLFLLWVWTTDWVNADAQHRRLPYLRWNLTVFGSFFAAQLLLWGLSSFAIGFLLMLAAWVVPLASYIKFRNGKVEPHEQVMTPAFLRYRLAPLLKQVGIDIGVEGEEKEPATMAKLLPLGGRDEQDNGRRLLAARESPSGFRDAGVLVGTAILRRSSAVMLDFGSESVNVRQLIDGLWLDAAPLPRESADPALESLMKLCSLNAQDRQARQTGAFRAEFENLPFDVSLTTQAAAGGQRALIQFDLKQSRFASLDELGMRPKMQEQFKALLTAPQGLVLFSAMPASGLRSTMSVTLRSLDRLTREFMALEEAKNRYEEIENIPVTVYEEGSGASRVDVLQRMLRSEPEVVLVRDLVDGPLVRTICQHATQNRLFVSTMRAKDAAEALLRVLALRVPPAELAQAVIGVLHQRLIRKLCEGCREPFTPAPQLLQKLGIPPDRAVTFYQPPAQPERVCRQCGGVGYKGRTAVFELLRVDENIRQALARTPKLETLRQAARAAGNRSLQEEALWLVANGTTSLQELSRALA